MSDAVPMAQGRSGIRLHLAGDPGGPPAVFLPGADWTGASGLSVAEAVPEFAWHCLDLPGTGGSQPLRVADQRGFAAWLAEFCDDLALGPIHLAGHSLGGFLALAAAASGRLSLRSLLLIDGGLGPLTTAQEIGPVAYVAPAMARLDAWLGGRLLAHRPGRPGAAAPPEDLSRLAARLGIEVSGSMRLAAQDAAGPGGPWNLDGRAVMRLGLLAMGLRQLPALSSLDIPVLALLALHPRGPAWTETLVARRRELLRRVPRVQVAELSTGHYPFWEDPDAFRRDVRPFYLALGT